MHLRRAASAVLLAALVAGCSEYELSPDGRKTAAEPDTGVLAGEVQVDEWDLAAITGTDILFFGDTSGSMTEELETLGDKVTDFVDRLDDYATDWQLAAVTGPSGCVVDRVFTPDDADYAERFAEAITTPPGQDLVDEWGLYNTTLAVEQSGPGDCNAGLVREGAILHIIFISDEDDNSPGWDEGDPDYWRAYVDRVVAVKGDADLVVYSGVVGPEPDGCEGAEPGVGYAEAVAATGGELLSICSDWSSSLDVLVDATEVYDTFTLSRTPDLSTLDVRVNGSMRGGWSYVSADNAVVFSSDPPHSGDTVTITYTVAAGG